MYNRNGDYYRVKPADVPLYFKRFHIATSAISFEAKRYKLGEIDADYFDAAVNRIICMEFKRNQDVAEHIKLDELFRVDAKLRAEAERRPVLFEDDGGEK